MNIGDRIKNRRIEIGFTQKDIADRLGVKDATVQRYESGSIKNLKQETIAKLAEILSVKPAYLMGWEDSSSSDYEISSTNIYEKKLIENFHSLNSEGRQKLLSYADDLLSSGKYAVESAEA